MTRPEHRFSEILTVVLEYLSVACIASITVLVIAQVVFRYVFNDPLDWSEEMARICFIYLTFIGIGAAYGRRRHMFLDAIVDMLTPRIAKVIRFSVVGISTAFLIFMIILTIRTMAELYHMEVNTPALEYPMAFVYLIVPIGLSALGVQMWMQLLKKG